MDAINRSGVRANLGDLPEEILTSVLQNHLDLSRRPMPGTVEQTCSDNPLQLLYSMQMSLCRVSRRFYSCASRLMQRNGLLRITCWLDPHLDFYYLSPTICRSDRTDMFQISPPHVTIYLTDDFADAVCVQSVASVQHLPLLLGIVLLHRSAGLVLLPSAYDVHSMTRKIYFTVSGKARNESTDLQTIKSLLSEHLPGLIEGAPVGEISPYVLENPETKITVPTSQWRDAFQLGRTLCLSPHRSSRRLGLKVVRYLLVSMIVATEPTKLSIADLQDSNPDLKMMALVSTALIDALVVEPELFSLFYDEDSADLAYVFHHDVCPCRYMPYGIDSGDVYGFASADTSWWVVRVAIHFLHSILVREASIQRTRIDALGQLRANLPLNAPELKARCGVYIEALERYHLSINCHRCLPSGLETSVQFPAMPDIQC